MLKWVSRSSVLHDIEEEDEVVDDVKKAKEEILDSASTQQVSMLYICDFW